MDIFVPLPEVSCAVCHRLRCDAGVEIESDSQLRSYLSPVTVSVLYSSPVRDLFL